MGTPIGILLTITLLALVVLTIMSIILTIILSRNKSLTHDLNNAKGGWTEQSKRAEAWKNKHDEWKDKHDKLYDEIAESAPKLSYITIKRRDGKPSPMSRGGYKVTKKTAMEMDKALKKITGNLYEGKPFIFETVDGKRVTVDRSRIEEIHIQIGD